MVFSDHTNNYHIHIFEKREQKGCIFFLEPHVFDIVMLYFKLSKVSKTWKQLMFHHLGTDDIYGDGGSNLQVTGHTVGGRCGNKSGGDFLDLNDFLPTLPSLSAE